MSDLAHNDDLIMMAAKPVIAAAFEASGSSSFAVYMSLAEEYLDRLEERVFEALSREPDGLARLERLDNSGAFEAYMLDHALDLLDEAAPWDRHKENTA